MKIKFYLITGLLAFGVSVTQAQLSNGLLLHYDFNNSSVDQSINGNDGVNTDIIYSTNEAGTLSSAGYFNGSSSSVELPSSGSVKPNLPITLTIKMKVDDLSINSPIAIPLYTSDFYYNNYAGFAIVIGNNGSVNATIGAGTGSGSANRRTFTTNELITEGVWHRITVVINAYNDMEIFIDCQAVTGSYSGTGPTTMSYSLNEGYIGQDAGNSFYPNPSFLKGSIDEVALWNRVLSSSELTAVCGGSLKAENLESEFFNIYPNPSSSNVNIQLPNGGELANLSYVVTDISGRVIENMNFSDVLQEINVSKLSKGVYIVSVFKDLDLMESKQFIVE